MAVTSATLHEDVVKSDSTVFSQTSAIFVGGGGNIALRLIGSSTTAVYKNIPSGTFMPVEADQVLSTGTTATDIIRVFN